MTAQTIVVLSSGPRLANPDLFKQQCFIDGGWVNAASGATLAVDDPATGALIGSVPAMGRDETAQAIAAAHRAWPLWRSKTAKERATIMRRWYELIIAHREDLALILTSEQGKPITESLGEITYGASFVEWFAEEGRRIYGDTIPEHRSGVKLMVLKQPIGVVASITPWNFPIAMITRKCAPALAAGCPVVIKPAEATPFSALALAVLAEAAGFPAGVVNVVTGDPVDIGMEMTSNPIVRKLSFTGSTRVGKLLMSRCATNVTKVSLELGGNAPFIVFDDADLDAAVAGAVQSKFRNAGQTCVTANRIYVQSGVYEAFAERFKVAVQKLTVGHGLEPDVSVGPLINEAAAKKIESHIVDAVAKGAKVVAGGGRHSRGGTFFRPTILTGVTAEMLVAKEETFGPLAPLFRFGSEEDVIDLANDTPYGLAAYFYARDLGRVWRVAEALEFGLIGINEGIITNEIAPFGGIKESGIGREGSKYGIEEYLELKYLCMGGLGR